MCSQGSRLSEAKRLPLGGLSAKKRLSGFPLRRFHNLLLFVYGKTGFLALADGVLAGDVPAASVVDADELDPRPVANLEGVLNVFGALELKILGGT